jgi:hypothetical protein
MLFLYLIAIVLAFLRLKEFKMKNILMLLCAFSLVACETISKTEHQTEGSALESVITREQQRVVRYDCKNKVISDKIETINSVSKQYGLSPKKTSKLYDFKAKNETTHKTAGHLWSNNGVFTLDLAPTVFNIDAVEGMNKISWSFSYCEKNKDGNCVSTPEIKESGVLYIHIRQDKIVKEGYQEIKPSKDECKH